MASRQQPDFFIIDTNERSLQSRYAAIEEDERNSVTDDPFKRVARFSRSKSVFGKPGMQNHFGKKRPRIVELWLQRRKKNSRSIQDRAPLPLRPQPLQIIAHAQSVACLSAVGEKRSR